jgi:hypothetical protein
MKVYNSVTIDMATGVVIAEDSYEYEGSLARCGGPDVDVSAPAPPPPPGPSPAETQLQNLQLEQAQTTAAFQDFQLQEAGFRRTAEGGFEEIPESELTPAQLERRQQQQRSSELLGLQQEEALRLQRGEGEVPVGLQQQFETQEAQLRERLRRALGPNFEQSTAGIQALAEFNKSKLALTDAARFGRLTQGEQLLQARLGLGSNIRAQETQRLLGLGTFGALSGALGQQQQLRLGLGQNLNQAFATQTGFLGQAQQSAVEQAGILPGAIGELAGTALGAGLSFASTGAAGAGASDERLKENIHDMESAIKIVKALRPVEFDWKDNGKHSVGLIAQELQELIPEAVVQIDEAGHLGINYNVVVPVLIKAVQELIAERGGSNG